MKAFTALCVLLWAPMATHGEDVFTNLRGQVTEKTALEENLYPIEGVGIFLDYIPEGGSPDGSPDHTQETGPFGFYDYQSVPNGTYRLTASHPAYEDYPAPEDDPVDIVLNDSDRKKHNIKLVPKYDPWTYFDVYFQVHCAQSNWELPGCPVRVQCFADSGGTQLLYDRTLQTSQDGVAIFRGVQKGYYRFYANQNGSPGHRGTWEVFSTVGKVDDLKHIDHPYMAHVFLKPVEQELTVQVGGLQLFKEAQIWSLSMGPLEGIFVVLEGVHPLKNDRVLIPPRTGVTDSDGKVTFRGLPGISYRAKARRLGFYETSRIINADVTGTLPATDQTISLQYYNNPTLQLPVAVSLDDFPTQGDNVVAAAVFGDHLYVRVLEKDGNEFFHTDYSDHILPQDAYLDYVKSQILLYAGWTLPTEQQGWLMDDLSNLFGMSFSEMDIHLHVIFDAGYSDTFLPTYYRETGHIGLRLSGMKSTNTEGVIRTAAGMLMGSTGTVFESGTAWLNYLVPGMYRLEHKGLVRMDYWDFVEPGVYTEHFFAKAHGEAIVELPSISDDDDSGMMDGRHHSVTLKTTFQPVEVRGRLYAADTIADPDGQPAYRPLGETVVNFVEHDGVDILSPANKTATTVTDSQGYFTISLPPSIYGITVDGVEDFLGSHIVVTPQVSDTEEAVGVPEQRKWPLHEVVPSGINDVYFAHFYDRGGIAMGKHDVVSMDLYLQKERYYLESRVLEDDLLLAIYYNEPMDQFGVARWSDLFNRATRIALVPDDASGDVGGRFYNGEEHKIVSWEGFVAGVYSSSIEHPRYSFDHQKYGGGGGTMNKIVFVDHPDPGKAPSLAFMDQFDGQDKVFYQPLQVPDYEDTRLYATRTGPTTGEQSADIYVWNDGSEQYDFLRNQSANLIALDFVSGVYLPGSSGPGTATDAWVKVDYSGETYWFNFTPGGAPATIQINDSTPTGSPPELNYDLTVRSRLDQDMVNGVGPVHFMYADGTGDSTFTSPAPPNSITISDRDKSPDILKDNRKLEPGTSNERLKDNWVWKRTREKVSISGGQPIVEKTVFVDQGMQVNVLVRDYDDQPMEGINLELLSSTGVTLSSGGDSTYRQRTNTEGVAIFNAVPGSRDYFLRLRVPGYQPILRRLDMDDAQDVSKEPEFDGTGTNFLHDLTTAGDAIDLVLLDQPEVAPLDGKLVPFDRYGGFLPGVTRAGNQSAFDSFSAAEVLTSKWEVELTRKTHQYQLPGFDNPDGSQRDPVDVTQVDDIREVWLVDKRVFNDDFYTGTVSTLEVPDINSPVEVARVLRSLYTVPESGERKLTYFSRTSQIENISGETFKATGEMELWKMPPGDFEPVFIAVSRMGAVQVYELDYQGNEELGATRLTGIPIPSWLGFAFDVIGFAGGVSTTQEQLETLVPDGKFLPMPEFSAEISQHEEDDEETPYIDYNYELTLWQREGQDVPANNLVGMAAGLLGGEWEVGASISMPGKDRELGLEISGTVEVSEEFEQDENENKAMPRKIRGFKPKILGSLRKVGEAEVTLAGEVGSTITKNYDSSVPYDVRLNNSVMMHIDSEINVNLQPVVGKVPYVGPVITTLDKLDLAKFYGTAEVGASLGTTYCWQTSKPTIHPTDPQLDRVPRIHFLGGYQPSGESDQNCDGFCHILCFRFGVGLKVLGGEEGEVAGAIGMIRLAGNDCVGDCNDVSDEGERPSVKIDLNPLGDWPPVRRISGSVNIELEAYLKTFIYDFEKDWSWELVKFDAQYGTESLFQLIPMSIHQETTGPGQFGESEFTGDSLVPVGAFQPTGVFRSGQPEGGAARLLYPDYDSQEGVMRLMVSERDVDGRWLAPEPIATGAIVAHPSMLELADGRLLIVWATIADEDMMEPFAPAQLMSSIFDPLTSTWSSPVEIASVENTPRSLHLAESGSLVSLVVVESVGGPASMAAQVYAASYSAGAWSGLTTCGSEQAVYDLAIATDGPSGTGEVHMHILDDVGNAGYFRWNGTIVTGPLTLDASSSFNSVSPMMMDDGTYRVAVALEDSGMGFYTASGPGEAYARDPVPAIPGSGSRLTARLLPHSSGDVVLLAWTEPALEGNSISYAFTDPSGEVLVGPHPLTGNVRGNYSQLHILPDGNRSGRVMTIYENDIPEMRHFMVSYDNGLADNDSDDDLMNDIGELLVVDALPSISGPADAITRVEHVLPGDDFDGDGYDNGIEIEEGTNPADRFDFPTFDGVYVTATTPDAQEYGTTPGIFRITRPDDDTSQPLTVHYSMGGTALEGTDYVTMPGSRTIASSSTTADVDVLPVSDSLPEGDETVILNLLEDAAYDVGTPSSAIVTIKDTPMDGWRMEYFPDDPQGADAQNMADPENDGLVNLLEYALYLDPGVDDFISIPQVSAYEHNDGETYAMLTYVRNADAVDLIYAVQVCDDLDPGNWQSGAGHVTEVIGLAPSTDAYGNPYVRVRTLVPVDDPGGGYQYLRLRVSPAP